MLCVTRIITIIVFFIAAIRAQIERELTRDMIHNTVNKNCGERNLTELWMQIMVEKSTAYVRRTFRSFFLLNGVESKISSS